MIAYDLLFQLSKIWPDSVQVRLGIAKAYINLKHYESASSALEVVEKLEPDNPEAHSWKALIKFEVKLRETNV